MSAWKIVSLTGGAGWSALALTAACNSTPVAQPEGGPKAPSASLDAALADGSAPDDGAAKTAGDDEAIRTLVRDVLKVAEAAGENLDLDDDAGKANCARVIARVGTKGPALMQQMRLMYTPVVASKLPEMPAESERMQKVLAKILKAGMLCGKDPAYRAAFGLDGDGGPPSPFSLRR